MPNQEQYIVEISKLGVGNYPFDFELDSSYFSSIEKSELIGGEIQVHADLSLYADRFCLALQARGTVQVTCDRCLDPMDLSVDVQDEDMEVEDGAKVLDLAWLAYELIVVHLPLVHCHPEGGCNPQMDALLHNHLCTKDIEDEDNA